MEVGKAADCLAEGRGGVHTLPLFHLCTSSSLHAEGLNWGLSPSLSFLIWGRFLGGPSSPLGTFVRIRKCIPSSGQMRS